MIYCDYCKKEIEIESEDVQEYLRYFCSEKCKKAWDRKMAINYDYIKKRIKR